MSKSLKSRLRLETLARRDALSQDMREQAAEAIADKLYQLRDRIGMGPLSGFWPIRSEIDPRPAMLRFSALNVPLALPVVTGSELVFRHWQPGEILKSGPFGLSEPFDTAEALDPSAMIVPLSAFDRRGHRIGYGAGFYDKAISRLASLTRPFTIGVGFSVQEINNVPDEAHDIPLDLIITENEIVIPKAI
jgi:5-formyltetrahydrofolate cyclo-ligase